MISCTSVRTVGRLSSEIVAVVAHVDTCCYVGLPLPYSRVGVNIWSTYLWAGIIGVSYGIRWNTAYPTLLDLLVQHDYIEVPIFSLEVGTQGDGSLNPSGMYKFS